MPRRPYTLIARGLPYGTTQERLWIQFPGAIRVKIHYDKISGEPTGSGFIDYSTEQAMTHALETYRRTAHEDLSHLSGYSGCRPFSLEHCHPPSVDLKGLRAELEMVLSEENLNKDPVYQELIFRRQDQWIFFDELLKTYKIKKFAAYDEDIIEAISTSPLLEFGSTETRGIANLLRPTKPFKPDKLIMRSCRLVSGCVPPVSRTNIPMMDPAIMDRGYIPDPNPLTVSPIRPQHKKSFGLPLRDHSCENGRNSIGSAYDYLSRQRNFNATGTLRRFNTPPRDDEPRGRSFTPRRNERRNDDQSVQDRFIGGKMKDGKGKGKDKGRDEWGKEKGKDFLSKEKGKDFWNKEKGMDDKGKEKENSNGKELMVSQLTMEGKRSIHDGQERSSTPQSIGRISHVDGKRTCRADAYSSENFPRTNSFYAIDKKIILTEASLPQKGSKSASQDDKERQTYLNDVINGEKEPTVRNETLRGSSNGRIAEENKESHLQNEETNWQGSSNGWITEENKESHVQNETWQGSSNGWIDNKVVAQKEETNWQGSSNGWIDNKVEEHKEETKWNFEGPNTNNFIEYRDEVVEWKKTDVYDENVAVEKIENLEWSDHWANISEWSKNQISNNDTVHVDSSKSCVRPKNSVHTEDSIHKGPELYQVPEPQPIDGCCRSSCIPSNICSESVRLSNVGSIHTGGVKHESIEERLSEKIISEQIPHGSEAKQSKKYSVAPSEIIRNSIPPSSAVSYRSEGKKSEKYSVTSPEIINNSTQVPSESEEKRSEKYSIVSPEIINNSSPLSSQPITQQQQLCHAPSEKNNLLIPSPNMSSRQPSLLSHSQSLHHSEGHSQNLVPCIGHSEVSSFRPSQLSHVAIHENREVTGGHDPYNHVRPEYRSDQLQRVQSTNGKVHENKEDSGTITYSQHPKSFNKVTMTNSQQSQLSNMGAVTSSQHPQPCHIGSFNSQHAPLNTDNYHMSHDNRIPLQAQQSDPSQIPHQSQQENSSHIIQSPPFRPPQRPHYSLQPFQSQQANQFQPDQYNPNLTEAERLYREFSQVNLLDDSGLSINSIDVKVMNDFDKFWKHEFATINGQQLFWSTYGGAGGKDYLLRLKRARRRVRISGYIEKYEKRKSSLDDSKDGNLPKGSTDGTIPAQTPHVHESNTHPAHVNTFHPSQLPPQTNQQSSMTAPPVHEFHPSQLPPQTNQRSSMTAPPVHEFHPSQLPPQTNQRSSMASPLQHRSSAQAHVSPHPSHTGSHPTYSSPMSGPSRSPCRSGYVQHSPVHVVMTDNRAPVGQQEFRQREWSDWSNNNWTSNGWQDWSQG